MRDRLLRGAGPIILALVFMFLGQCTPSKTGTRTDMPGVTVESVGGKAVKLNVVIFFNDVHTRHPKYRYERRFFNDLKEIDYLNLLNREESLAFMRAHVKNTSKNYWLGLAERHDARPYKEFGGSVIDFVIFYHGVIKGHESQAAECKIYLMNAKELSVDEFQDVQYDQQSFSAVYIEATRKFNAYINRAFPEAYRKKVQALK